MAIVTSGANSVRTTDGDWQSRIKTAIRSSRELLARLELPVASGNVERIEDDFPVFVPEPFFRRMKRGDSQDPLLLQVLAKSSEAHQVQGFVSDPVGELASQPTPGVIYKYPGRALLITTGACAIHCRYCFRRHFPYQQTPVTDNQWRDSLQPIRDDPSVEEVILSGGDPLMLVDSKIAKLVALIEEVHHVTRLRVHTRLPIVIPQRVTRTLLDILSKSRLMTVLVVHANHPQELDAMVEQALCRVTHRGITLLNQSVLLRGINDQGPVLADLSRRLIGAGCLPYYLHQLDRVAGAAHFEVPVERGREIMGYLRTCLPGYAVPRYVCDAGGNAKQILA